MDLKELNEKFKNDAFFTKVKGVTMNNRQQNVAVLKPAQKLHLKFEDDNPVDSNAIKLFADPAQTIEIGYVSKELAVYLQEFRKQNIEFEIRVSQVTGGGLNKSHGCNILVILKRLSGEALAKGDHK